MGGGWREREESRLGEAAAGGATGPPGLPFPPLRRLPWAARLGHVSLEQAGRGLPDRSLARSSPRPGGCGVGTKRRGGPLGLAGLSFNHVLPIEVGWGPRGPCRASACPMWGVGWLPSGLSLPSHPLFAFIEKFSTPPHFIPPPPICVPPVAPCPLSFPWPTSVCSLLPSRKIQKKRNCRCQNNCPTPFYFLNNNPISTSPGFALPG